MTGAPKIACLHLPNAQYGVLAEFARAWTRALRRLGCRAVLADEKAVESNQHVERWIRKQAPDRLVAFNVLLEDSAGGLIHEQAQLPLLTYMVDSPHCYWPIPPSANLSAACVDGRDARFLSDQGYIEDTRHLPHAADAELCVLPLERPEYDVVFFGTWIDPRGIERQWEGQFSKEQRDALHQAAERCYADRSLYSWDVLTSVYEDKIDAIMQLWHHLDVYLRALDRTKLLGALNGLNVHVFGHGLGSGQWEQWEERPKSVTLHSAVSFAEAVQVMRRSRVVLNTFPTFYEGGHERLFTGMAAGAALVTNHTQYIEEQFASDEELLIYDARHPEGLCERIQDLLDDHLKWEAMRQAGRQKVQLQHTWDVRLKPLVEEWIQ